MIADVAHTGTAVRADGRLPLVRWAALGALLLVEGLALGLRFDTGSLQGLGGSWWVGPLRRISQVLPIAVAVGTAVALLGSARLRAAGAAFAPALGWARVTWPFLLGHVASFAALAWATAEVLERERLTTAAAPGLWVVLWLALGALTVGCWLLLAVPPAALGGLLRATAPALGAAGAVGIGAYAAGQITTDLWYPLRGWTFALVGALVRLLPDPVVAPAELLVGTERFTVRIAPQCSGYEGIGLTTVFLAAYLVAFRRTLRFPQALLLLPMGAVAVWAGNALRIVALVCVGTWISPEIAFGGFHSYAGSLLFCAIALALAWVASRSSFFSVAPTRPTTPGEVATADVTTAYVGPFVTIVAVAMATGTFSTGEFDALYPLRVGAVLVVLWRCRDAYGAWRWAWSWPAAGIGAAVAAVWIALALVDGAHAGPPPALTTWPPLVTGAWLACRLFGAVVTVPLAEELAFRGYVMRRIGAADFARVPLAQAPLLGVVVSALLFGLLHDRILAGTLAGAAYALAARRRGELADAVVAHAATNALLAAYVAATGNWAVW